MHLDIDIINCTIRKQIMGIVIFSFFSMNNLVSTETAFDFSNVVLE